jgi:hypothetical protein
MRPLPAARPAGVETTGPVELVHIQPVTILNCSAARRQWASWVAAFLAFEAARHIKPSTIGRRLAACSCHATGHPALEPYCCVPQGAFADSSLDKARRIFDHQCQGVDRKLCQGSLGDQRAGSTITIRLSRRRGIDRRVALPAYSYDVAPSRHCPLHPAAHLDWQSRQPTPSAPQGLARAPTPSDASATRPAIPPA